MTTRFLTLALLMAATASACYGQLTLLSNGDFQSNPNFKNWTTTGDANIWTESVNGFPPPDSTSTTDQYAELGTDLPPPPTPTAVTASALETFLFGSSSGQLST